MSFNISALYERVADRVPGRVAIKTPARTLTYAELDARADRLAAHLQRSGIGKGDHVGLQLLNGMEYMEAMLAAFKLSAVPVNINYRYVATELQSLVDDADLDALILHRQFGPVVSEVLHSAPRIRHLLVVDDDSGAEPPGGAVDYEAALEQTVAGREWTGRSASDLYITYTGGTTGLPKGVLWRHDDLFFAALGGGDPTRDKGPIGVPDELADRISDFSLIMLLAPPLVHNSAHWGALNALLSGWTVVLASPGRFDPAEIWRLVAEHGVNGIVIVGDAMAVPLVASLDPDTDTSSLLVIASGGAILSPAVKRRIADALPNVIILDTFASSESGLLAMRIGAGERFVVDDRTAVLDDRLRPVEPGSGQIGRVARRGHVPLRYHKDEARSARTFIELDGNRWALPGDMATVADDGTIELLGRGSGCINTGGEKVFPEEVEAVLKGYPNVVDVLVVGVPDERFGSKVAAIVQPEPGSSIDLAELQGYARADLAGYKLPRELVLVDQVRRGPNGKPDYPWAEAVAVGRVASR